MTSVTVDISLRTEEHQDTANLTEEVVFFIRIGQKCQAYLFISLE